jgi:hypothetical protein
MFVAAALFLCDLTNSFTSQLLGIAWISATSPLMFQRHYYHPSDFYGTALMFLILMAARNVRFVLLGVLCLASGFLWEKAFFVPLIFFLCIRHQTDLKTAIVRTSPALAATVLYFLIWRWAFPAAERISPYADWGQFFNTLPDAGLQWLLWTAPIFLVLIDSLRSHDGIERLWSYWLLYVPILIGVIAVVRGHLGELRSFWILQPVFVAVLASWADRKNKGGGALTLENTESLSTL